MSAAVRFPSLFVSHGAPNMILYRNSVYDNHTSFLIAKDSTVEFLEKWGKKIRKIGTPKAILMVSAHWESPEFRVTTKLDHILSHF